MAKKYYACDFSECPLEGKSPFPVEDLDVWECECGNRNCPEDTLNEVPFGQRHPVLSGFLKFGVPIILIAAAIWLIWPSKILSEAKDFLARCEELSGSVDDSLRLSKRRSGGGYPGHLREVGARVDGAVTEATELKELSLVEGKPPEKSTIENEEASYEALALVEAGQKRAEIFFEPIQDRAGSLSELAKDARIFLDQANVPANQGSEDGIDEALVKEVTRLAGENPVASAGELMEEGDRLLKEATRKNNQQAATKVREGMAYLDSIERNLQQRSREKIASVKRSAEQLRQMIDDADSTVKGKLREIELIESDWKARLGQVKRKLEEKKRQYREAPIVFAVASQVSLSDRLVIPVFIAFLKQKRKVPADEIMVFKEAPYRVAWKEGKEYHAVSMVRTDDQQVFSLLAEGEADMVVTARTPDEKEKAYLAEIGDMDSNSCARVIALDAIAIVLHATSRAETFSAKAVSDLLAGKRTVSIPSQGEMVSRTFSRVVFPSPDSKSGYIIPLLKKLANGSLKSAEYARSDISPAAEVNGADQIGFDAYSSLPPGTKVASVKPDKHSEVRKPAPVPIGTEDYRYAFRMIAYYPEQLKTGLLEDFLNFLGSTEGQSEVGKLGFVDQNLTLQPHDRPKEFVDRLAEAVDLQPDQVLSAHRMSTTLRFKTASKDLDLKARADVDRLIERIRFLEPDRCVVLAGFADNTGSFDNNLTLSGGRADEVTEELSEREVRSEDKIGSLGFSSDYPVDSNESEDGRQRNRRVEVWVLEVKS